MLQKYGRFYADWTDNKGKRFRKSFATEAEAEVYQLTMRSRFAGKKPARKMAGASHRSRKSSGPSRAIRSEQTPSTTASGASSRRSAQRHRASSSRSISRASAKPSSGTVSPRATTTIRTSAPSSENSRKATARRTDCTAKSRKCKLPAHARERSTMRRSK